MVTLKVGMAIWYHDIHLDTDSHFEVSWGWDVDIIWHVLAYHTIVLARALRQFEQILSKNDMRITKANSRWDPFSPSSAKFHALHLHLHKKKNNKKQCIESAQPATRCPLQYTFHHKALSDFHTTTQQVLVWIEPPRFRPDTNVLQLTSSEHHDRQEQERLLMATAGNWWHVFAGINSSFYLL